MTPPWKRHSFTLPVGAATGLLSGMLGIGGGLVAGPSLALAGLPLQRALGTAVVVVAPVAAVGVLSEVFTDVAHLVWTIAIALAVGGQMGAPLGAWIAMRLPERALRFAFVVLLLYTAARSLGFIGGAPPDAALTAWGGESAAVRHSLAVVAGILAGMSSSLFGIGGGVVVVPALIYVVGGFTFHEAAGTSLLAMVPTAARAALLAARQGRVQPEVAFSLVPVAIVGAVVAVVVRNFWLTPAVLSQIFGVFLLIVSWRLLRQSPASRRPS